jgi:hypothetical protein
MLAWRIPGIALFVVIVGTVGYLLNTLLRYRLAFPNRPIG